MKHQFINKTTGRIGSVMVVTFDTEDDNKIQNYSYEYVEDLMEEWAAYEPYKQGEESRKIKYRVWDNENKSYNDPYSYAYYALTQDGGLDFYCHGDHMDSCDPVIYTIEQCTGLADKNGTPIYEGDVVSWTNSAGESITYEVYFNKLKAAFLMNPIVDGEHIEGMSTKKTPYIEVIGNIHQNPELLGGKR